MLPPASFVIRQCSSDSCSFRFPVEKDNPRGLICPHCGAETVLSVEIVSSPPNPPVHLPGTTIFQGLLDNVRSTFNVGAIFRTADGLGFRKLHLCGITPTPDHPKIGKTALGAEHDVAWQYHRSSLLAAQQLKSEGAILWALEASAASISLTQAVQEQPIERLVLIAGNERAGVDPHLLQLCDRVIWIPMQGHKESLNVAIAFSIAAYSLRFSRLL